MKAIIYTSNIGSTAEYAQLLGKELNLPVHSLQKAKNKVPAGSEIIYLGWIMAGGIKGYKKAAKLYKVCVVCGDVMVKTAGKGLANKPDRTPEEDDMLDMMVNGGKRVSLQNLKAVTEWYKSVF